MARRRAMVVTREVLGPERVDDGWYDSAPEPRPDETDEEAAERIREQARAVVRRDLAVVHGGEAEPDDPSRHDWRMGALAEDVAAEVEEAVDEAEFRDGPEGSAPPLGGGDPGEPSDQVEDAPPEASPEVGPEADPAGDEPISGEQLELGADEPDGPIFGAGAGPYLGLDGLTEPVILDAARVESLALKAGAYVLVIAQTWTPDTARALTAAVLAADHVTVRGVAVRPGAFRDVLARWTVRGEVLELSKMRGKHLYALRLRLALDAPMPRDIAGLEAWRRQRIDGAADHCYVAISAEEPVGEQMSVW